MKKTSWIANLVIALLIFVVIYFIYFKPQSEKIAEIRAERVKLEAEVQKLKAQKRELDKIEAELTRMRAQMKELELIIPQRREIADILRQIQQLAYDARLDIIKFAPQGELNKEFYSEWPIPIQVNGSYHNLGVFFDRLGRFPRLFTVDRFTIKALSRQTDLTTISADWTAKTYLFIEEPLAKVPTTKTARPKK